MRVAASPARRADVVVREECGRSPLVNRMRTIATGNTTAMNQRACRRSHLTNPT